MENDRLKEIMDSHIRWLNCEDDGVRADLRGSNLSLSDLRESNLSESNLSGSNLSGSDLSGSNLSWSDLSGSNLSGSSLRGSNLRGSNLSWSDLSESDLREAKLPPFQICDGDLIGWKKIYKKIVKIKIPHQARRTASLVSRKCRAEYAEVIEIDDGKMSEIQGGYADLVYRVGESVYPDSYDDDIRVDCTHGIHFFQTREEAEEY
jgi:hypothetical protein